MLIPGLTVAGFLLGGAPDSAWLNRESDRQAFRRWFTFLAGVRFGIAWVLLITAWIILARQVSEPRP